jgi:ferrous iron transport protein A
MMPLTFAKSGETNCIKRISGNDEVRRHLAELGFVVGELVTVVSEMGGNMILSVKDSRIALDKTMVNRIII